MTGSDVTGSDVSHVPCPEICLTGSDKVTWSDEALSGSGPDRKYVLRMPHFPLRLFLSSSTVVTWLPDVTKGHLTPSGFSWASSGHVTLSLPVKKAPLERILCNFRLRMSRTYFRIGHVTNVTSGHVTSGHAQWSDPPHDPPQMRLELSPYTTVIGALMILFKSSVSWLNTGGSPSFSGSPVFRVLMK